VGWFGPEVQGRWPLARMVIVDGVVNTSADVVVRFTTAQEAQRRLDGIGVRGDRQDGSADGHNGFSE